MIRFEDAVEGEIFEFHYLSEGYDYIVQKKDDRWKSLETKHNKNDMFWRLHNATYEHSSFASDQHDYECISHGVELDYW